MSELSPGQRSWLLGQLSTDTARRVLALLTCHAGACTATFLAGSSGVDLPETRRILVKAFTVGLVDYHHDTGTDTIRYTITAAGRDHLNRPPAPIPGSTYERVEIIDDPAPVIDDDASAIVVDDQPSSAPMTGPARRGRPTWCTPGHGVCLGCKEGS